MAVSSFLIFYNAINFGAKPLFFFSVKKMFTLILACDTVSHIYRCVGCLVIVFAKLCWQIKKKRDGYQIARSVSRKSENRKWNQQAEGFSRPYIRSFSCFLWCLCL